MKYIHSEAVHNLQAPQEIVPRVIELLRPNSVIDVGCGIGTFLHVFKQHHVVDVLGVDGDWVDRGLLSKYLAPAEFVERDLETPLNVGRRFDLVVCLEVAEHLGAHAAATFIDSLTTLGDAILFSAAIPGQGGQNHLNEQPLSYWISLFQARGFRYNDSVRRLFWTNDKVQWWYRQNMVLFLRNGTHSALPASDQSTADVVHPDSWQAKTWIDLVRLTEGEANLSRYLRLLAKRAVGRTVWERVTRRTFRQ